jgi:hypothetical protein
VAGLAAGVELEHDVPAREVSVNHLMMTKTKIEIITKRKERGARTDR